MAADVGEVGVDADFRELEYLAPDCRDGLLDGALRARSPA